MINYNSFHLKNKKIQFKVISDKDYTYQSLIKKIDKYFLIKGKVLDLGCGVGTIDFFLASKGFDVTGVDVSDRAINLADFSKKNLKLKNVNFFCDSVESFATDKKFDYIICSEVLEHVVDPVRVMNKIYSYLKEDGIAIVSVPSLNAPLYKWGMLAKFDTAVGHLRRYEADSFVNQLKEVGFIILELKKVEGLFRNLLYTNKFFGELVRFIRFPVTLVVNSFDDFLVKIFGESNIYVILKKI